MLKSTSFKPISVAVVGAGPNGLCAAAFLSAAGANVHIFGVPLESWKGKMPQGMILRSTRASSNIASPGNRLSILEYEKQTGDKIDYHPTIEQFIAYGEWYQKAGVPEIDPTRVQMVRRANDRFRLELEDGRSLRTDAVVMATGINPFPHIPTEFAFIPKELASHSSEHKNFEQFRQKRVAVIGKGQSALESAALLSESGANVEILTRGSQLTFIKNVKRRGLWDQFCSIPSIHQFLYPPTDLAGPPNNWAIADPVIYRGLSDAEQARLFDLIGPIGSDYLEARLAGVKVTTRVEVRECREQGDQLCLALSDGTERAVDHVILATGFHPDIDRLEMLSDELKAQIKLVDRYPALTLGYESKSVKGLYFVGALACRSLGPINRFVCGTSLVGQYLTQAVTGSKIGSPQKGTRLYVAGRQLMYHTFRLSGRILSRA